MEATPEEVASAFSSHRFDEAIPHLRDDVVWMLVGADDLTGKDAVAAACAGTVRHLAGATTEFRQFKTVVGQGSVVVDSVADYTGAEGDKSTVASCDIFDFEDGKVAKIRSYNIELAP